MTSTTEPIPITKPQRTRFPLGTLLPLAAATMIAVTAEMMPAGVLPEMAASLSVEPVQIGVLVTIWAVTIIVTSMPLTRITSSLDRRLVVGASMLVFAVANALTAIAPVYEVVVVSRVLAAIAHGLFWSIVMVYTAQLVAREHLGRAISIVSGGVAVATVIGLPAGTALAQALDWRTSFWVLAVVMAVIGLLVLTRMPRVTPAQPASEEGRPHLTADRTILPSTGVGLTAALLALAHFSLFTYIVPYFDEAAGFDPEWTSTLLLVFGGAGAVGLILSGIVADRWPSRAVITSLLLFAASAFTLALLARTPAVVIAAILIWGVASGALPPLMNARMMQVASEALRPLASAALVVFFNVGIGLGSLIGGLIESASGPQAIATFAGCILVASTLVAVATAVVLRSRVAPR